MQNNNNNSYKILKKITFEVFLSVCLFLSLSLSLSDPNKAFVFTPSFSVIDMYHNSCFENKDFPKQYKCHIQTSLNISYRNDG